MRVYSDQWSIGASMTPVLPPRGRVRARSGRIRAGAALAGAFAALVGLVTGCGTEDAAPAWGYPELRTTLRSFSRALQDLEEGCDETTPASCVDDLDRLHVLADRAFAQVLDHKLLDREYVEAVNALDKARRLRLTAAEEARSGNDPHAFPFRHAVLAEWLGYEHLLAQLERLRTAPPPGDGTEPV